MERYIKRQKSRRIKKYFLVTFISILVFIIILLLYQNYMNIDVTKSIGVEENNVERTSQTFNYAHKEDEELQNMIEKTTSCVVGISKIKDTGSTIFLNDGVSELGLGSGVIVTENGYILSNEHVTGKKFSNCYVTLEDGRSYKANVVWSNSSLDLSICKINMTGLTYATLGSSENIKVGQAVYAIGNPIGFEFQRTVTAGIISAVNRTIKLEEKQENEIKVSYMDDLIQTDATINQGNSGGPLINANGEIIGINTVKITSAEGIGFAVPIDVVKPIINRFSKEGKFEEATLGIFAYDKNMISYIDTSIEIENGIYVAEITRYSPASQVNLTIGDIITKIDNTELNKMSDLRRYIYSKKPGDKVTLTVYRKNREYQLDIILGK